MLAFYFGILVLSLVFQTWVAVIYWLLPRIMGEPIERIIRLGEHNGCEHTPDMLINSRTILSWKPVRWLSWNMPLHTAHHAVPMVPFYAIPKLNKYLVGHTRDVRSGYPATVAFQIKRLIDQGRQPRGS